MHLKLYYIKYDAGRGIKGQGKGIQMGWGVLCTLYSVDTVLFLFVNYPFSVSVDLTGVLEITQLAKCSIENNLLISFSFIFISHRSLAMRKIDHLLDVKR